MFCYPPAGAAPVRLLVEAKASPAFLRRARVWAQHAACTKRAGGKALKKKKTQTKTSEEHRKQENKKKVRECNQDGGGSSTEEEQEEASPGLFVETEPSSQTVSSSQHGKTPTAARISTEILDGFSFSSRDAAIKLLRSQENPEKRSRLGTKINAGSIEKCLRGDLKTPSTDKFSSTFFVRE